MPVPLPQFSHLLVLWPWARQWPQFLCGMMELLWGVDGLRWLTCRDPVCALCCGSASCLWRWMGHLERPCTQALGEQGERSSPSMGSRAPGGSWRLLLGAVCSSDAGGRREGHHCGPLLQLPCDHSWFCWVSRWGACGTHHWGALSTTAPSPSKVYSVLK